MKEMTKRILMTLTGVSVSGFSVGMFNFSVMGVDPFQVLMHGIAKHVPIDFGTLYMICNLIMLAAIFFADRKKIGLGTFINIFLLGYIVEYSSALFAGLIPNPDLPVRIVFLIIGIVILCFGSALYFTGDLGVSTYDAVALILSEKFPAKFQYVRIATDLVCTGTGFLLGGVVGVGTLVTAFFMGPLIMFFRHHIAMPLRYGKAGAAERIAAENSKRKQKT